jgi:ABC-type phosphate/phosphonate transport system substrate-binding protein
MRIFFISGAAFGLFLFSDGFAQAPKTTVHIGIVPSLTADLSPGQQKIIDNEFPNMVRDFTGLPGQLDKTASAEELADKMAAGTLQFGVFQGIEFAEARVKHPDLQPLLLAVYRGTQIKALLVTKKDAAYQSFADLRGKDVIVLKDGKEHIRRYALKEAGGDPAKFFGNIVKPANGEASLDGILQDKGVAALVDNAVLDIYLEVNPGRFARLRIIGESAPFPPSVVAYEPKKVDAKVVTQFKTGMLKANQSVKGRDVMSTFKISSFTAVPGEFDKQLAEIRKAYP